MNNEERRAFLDELFRNGGFARLYHAGKKHEARETVCELSTGARIVVRFPGKKANMDRGNLVMDFRIDFERDGTSIAPSHANIVADIYNKVRNGKMPPAELRRTLVKLAITGEIDIEQARAELRYNVVRPSEELKEEVRNAHGLKADHYSAEMNDRDLDLEELFELIGWIALQEDINYPRGQGRKMPFSRYIEAVVAADRRERELADVVQRAVMHYRPPEDWPEVDYSFRKHVH